MIFRNVAKKLLLQLVVNGSIITKLSLQVFMVVYENTGCPKKTQHV